MITRKTFIQFATLSTFLAACAPVAASQKSGAMTRAEIAPLLIDVYVGMTGETPTVVDCPFVDIDALPDNQREAICQLWGLGVVVGTERDVRYSPELPAGEWGGIVLRNLAEVVERAK